MNIPVTGQCWMSQTEPELGIGTIVEVNSRQVRVLFTGREVTRCYALSSAPLQRVLFRKGDHVRVDDGTNMIVSQVTEENGLMIYHGKNRILPESEISAKMSTGTPRDRLLIGQTDSCQAFDLRLATLEQQHRIRSSPIRGFLGGRVELMPHQFYIADEVAKRIAPRVLLSDETGLGKTIEACLILHRLLTAGQIRRVLLLLPESLVHQWFVELYRRFNLIFKIYDESVCVSIEEQESGINPFDQDQQIICCLDFTVSDPKRTAQIISGSWDMVIVDEAHHLKEKSPEYELVHALSRQTKSLLLLTATPEQLGVREHFARLKLLDPDRYFDEERFMEESERYRDIAGIANQILDKKSLTLKQKKTLSVQFPDLYRKDGSDRSPVFTNKLERQKFIDELIDRHGIGRVVFRNTRNTVKGFPARDAFIIPLDKNHKDLNYLNVLAKIFQGENDGKNVDETLLSFDTDPRIKWLADMLRKEKDEKFLLICRSREKAEQIHAALKQQINVNTALFHENLTMMQRDRNAAWFSEPEGARILICSEIGSEGRNFQFARNLVLFDLPLDPEQIEQRIGRLDRIGQKSRIQIFIPYISGSVHEVMARWYHEGIDGFRKNPAGGSRIRERFSEDLKKLALDFHKSGKKGKSRLNKLIAETSDFCRDIAKILQKGRDRLLELCAFKPEKAAVIIDMIRKKDLDESIDRFIIQRLEHFGMNVTDIGPRTFLISPTPALNEGFTFFKEEETAITFDRNIAVIREDLIFITWDHPLVTNMFEMILGSESGNCALAVMEGDGRKPELLLETIFMLECVASKHLSADRFLPSVPVRTVVNHELVDVTKSYTWVNSENGLPENKLKDCSSNQFPTYPKDRVLEMIETARKIVQIRKNQIIRSSMQAMSKTLDAEINRLADLSRINPGIRREEIELALREKGQMEEAISGTRLRLDAVRLIWKG